MLNTLKIIALQSEDTAPKDCILKLHIMMSWRVLGTLLFQCRAEHHLGSACPKEEHLEWYALVESLKYFCQKCKRKMKVT